MTGRRLLSSIPKSYSSAKNIGGDTNCKPRTHIIFGSNTDVGKTIVSTGLVRSSSISSNSEVPSGNKVHYIKPLQCGGSDEAFVRRYAPRVHEAQTLFRWETPASPHIAAVQENYPVSDEQVLKAVDEALVAKRTADTTVWLETAGGVLSPSSASPDNNNSDRHAQHGNGWGWMAQADLYVPLVDTTSVVLVGDGRLGGISATLTALESLHARDYKIHGIILMEDPTHDNVTALREYVTMIRNTRDIIDDGWDIESAIVSLPHVPPEPEPLDKWYDEVNDTFVAFNQHLEQRWINQHGALI